MVGIVKGDSYSFRTTFVISVTLKGLKAYSGQGAVGNGHADGGAEMEGG